MIFRMKWVSVLIFISFCLSAKADANSGGEIGNGRFVRYNNAVSEFSTFYPKVWNRFEMGSAVNFVENGLPVAEASAVNISLQKLPEIKTLIDLERYLKRVQPLVVWKTIKLDGNPGFEASTGSSQGMIYLLRSSEGSILSIRHQKNKGKQAQEDVKMIIESIALQSDD